MTKAIAGGMANHEYRGYRGVKKARKNDEAFAGNIELLGSIDTNLKWCDLCTFSFRF